MTPPTPVPPSVEQLRLALDILEGINGPSHVYDDEANASCCDSCDASVGRHKAGCRWLAIHNALQPLTIHINLLQSGQYALISTDDRESALTKMYFASMADDNGDEAAANTAEVEARTLLQLPPQETP